MPYHSITYLTISYHTIPSYATIYHTIPSDTLPFHNISSYTIGSTPYHQIYLSYNKTPSYTIIYHIIHSYNIPFETIPCNTITSYITPATLGCPKVSQGVDRNSFITDVLVLLLTPNIIKNTFHLSFVSYDIYLSIMLCDKNGR